MSIRDARLRVVRSISRTCVHTCSDRGRPVDPFAGDEGKRLAARRAPRPPPPRLSLPRETRAATPCVMRKDICCPLLPARPTPRARRFPSLSRPRIVTLAPRTRDVQWVAKRFFRTSLVETKTLEIAPKLHVTTFAVVEVNLPSKIIVRSKATITYAKITVR